MTTSHGSTRLHRSSGTLTRRRFAGTLAAALMLGCASYRARRERYKAAAEGEVIVRGTAEQFTMGGRASFIREECSQPDPASSGPSAPGRVCRDVVIGGGDVVERLDRFHFVVRADPGVEYKRATRIVPAQR